MRCHPPLVFLSTLMLVACGSPAGEATDATVTGDATAPGPDAAPEADAAPGPDAATEPGPFGFIGSPCDSVSDCDYADAECVTEDFPNGTCTQACDLYCPDQDGFPTTFCVAAGALPTSAASLGDGACLSRCDFGLFPGNGCRPGYGCVEVARANEPGTLRSACMPGAETQLSSCLEDLANRGVSFEPTTVADDHPATHPNLTCHIEEPVYLNSPVLGVALHNSAGTETPRILVSCAAAHAVVSTIEDVAPHGVSAMRQMGTYNCRVISGTDSLSMHSFAAAIDIAGFEFTNGDVYTLTDHWEHDTTAPQSPGGIFLYEAAHRWFDAHVWNIILTPNYNAAHDDHFHVDLTTGSHFLGFTDGRYIGPAPYDD